MLSLSPRFDLFRFCFPKSFIPEEIYKKYEKVLNTTPGVLVDPINYLNESIQKVSFPGIQDITTSQDQHSFNAIRETANRIHVEPRREATYNTTKNPLDCINKEFKVDLRMNQGLYNYFMLYETVFYKLCKPLSYPPEEVLMIEILDEDGSVVSRIKLFDAYIDGLEGLDFDYSKLTRDVEIFSITFKFNNIDFDFGV